MAVFKFLPTIDDPSAEFDRIARNENEGFALGEIEAWPIFPVAALIDAPKSGEVIFAI
jgi:hypothetical protein